MTRDYEPIEITENTLEPSDGAEFFLTDKDDDYSTVATVTEDGWFLPGYESEFFWEEIRDKYIGWRIQSLAAHDAQIRAGALDFANAKQIENSEELLNESLSKVVEEYLLYGAHPLSTEEDSDDIWDDADLSKLRLTNGDVINCSELADEVVDGLKRYLDGRPVLQSIPTSGVEG